MDFLQPSSKCPKFSDDNGEADYFGKLHDDILILILDKLPLVDAMGTSLLSKRFKDLWKHKRDIELGHTWRQRCDMNVRSSFSKICGALQQQNIRSTSVSHPHYCYASCILNLLICFASQRHLEEVYVDLNDRNDTFNRMKYRRRYALIDMSSWVDHPCVSLSKLIMKSIKLDTLPPSCFMALRELYLEQVKLIKNSVEEISTNCPSLVLMSLCNCNPTNDLNVSIAANSNLLHLVINEEFTDVQNTTMLCIRAANVKTIEFASALPRKGYQVEQSLACSEAIFRLDKMHHSLQATRVYCSGIKGNHTKNFLGLLKELATVKVLTVSSWCIQALSMEVFNFRGPLTFEASHLILKTGLCRWEFQGIAYLLLGCCKLENLTIVMGTPAYLNYDSIKDVALRKVGNTGVQFDKILQQLETIEFKNYTGIYQAWDGDDFNESLYFAGSDFGRLLVWNLKTYADNLKKVVFSTRQKHFASDQFQSVEDLSTFKSLCQCHLPCVYRNPADRCHPAPVGVKYRSLK